MEIVAFSALLVLSLALGLAGTRLVVSVLFFLMTPRPTYARAVSRRFDSGQM